MSKAPAVDYALRIIEFFSETQKEIGIADICNSLEINKNAASRVLESLLEQKWIYLSNESQKKYRFTMKPFSLVSKCTPEYAFAEVAENDLRNLNEQLGDAVYLGVKNNENVLYLLHFDSKKEVRINGRIGGEYPLRTSAPGKVLLANGEYSQDFADEAKKIKAVGYATDNEEFAKGIICIACPVYNAGNDVVAAVGISSLTIYDDINSLVRDKLPYLKDAARNISLNLGYKGTLIMFCDSNIERYVKKKFYDELNILSPIKRFAKKFKLETEALKLEIKGDDEIVGWFFFDRKCNDEVTFSDEALDEDELQIINAPENFNSRTSVDRGHTLIDYDTIIKNGLVFYIKNQEFFNKTCKIGIFK